MATRFSTPSVLMGPEDECCFKACVGHFPAGNLSPTSASDSAETNGHRRIDDAETPSVQSEHDEMSDDLERSPETHLEELLDVPDAEDTEHSAGWHYPVAAASTSEREDASVRTPAADVTASLSDEPINLSAKFTEDGQRPHWKKATMTAAASAAAAAAATAAAATERLAMMQLFVSRLLTAGSRSLPDQGSKRNVKPDSEECVTKVSEVSMAFHERGHASELLQYHFMILNLAVTVAFGTQNALAPNLSRIAETFHFSEAEKDLRVGGELAFLYYAPGCIGALAMGICAGMLDRNRLVSAVLLLAGLSSFCTFFVNAYWQLAVLRLTAGLAGGGFHPLAYSLVGDWFGPSLRSCASAFVLGAAGFGTFCGQCLAALLGSLDWRWVFLILAAPLLFMAHFYYLANGRLGGPLTHHMEFGGAQRQQELTLDGLKGMAKSKTNILMLVQAFPGNVPWGVLIIYLHDFLRTDIGLSDNAAIAAIVAVAAASFCGMIVGGMIGGHLYARSGRRLLRFCSCISVLRCIPCVMIFAFPAAMGKAPEGPTLLLLLVLLLAAAFGSALPTANIGAVLLNVNTAEVRGTICAIYTVLDDISKALGTVVASLLGAVVGSRALAFQLSMSLWLLSAAALFAASFTYAEDEAQVIEAEQRRGGVGFRQLSDEGAQDRMPLLLKQQKNVIQQDTSAVTQRILHESQDGIIDVRLRMLKPAEQAHKPSSNETAAGIWEQLEEHGNCSQHRSRL